MDPAAPRTAPDPADVARLQRVQRRIVSALAFTTILHLSAGFVIAADHVSAERPDARVALCLIGGAFGVGAVLSLLVINRRPWQSPWLLLGALPAVLGIWWTVL